MKKLYFSVALFLISFFVEGQIVSIPDANFKAKLLAASPSNTTAKGTGSYIAIDTNGNGEIEISEALLIRYLDVNNSSISSLEGIASFTNLRTLKCNTNNLTVLDLSALTFLTTIDCSVNQLTQLNPTQFNNNITSFNCNSNFLTSLNVNSLSGLKTLNCSQNLLTSLNADLINNTITLFDCSYNNLTSLIVPNFFPFLDMGPQTLYLNCSHNQISTIAFDQTNGREDLSGLNLSYNNLTDLTLSNITVYGSVTVSNNPLNNLTFTGFSMGPQEPDGTLGLYIENTNLSHLKIPRTSSTIISIKDNPNLISLDLKNGYDNAHYYIYYIGEDEYYGVEGLIFENNPLLSFVCCDDSQSVFEYSYIVSLLPDAQVSEYCTFTPGGNFNAISGNVGLNCPSGDLLDSGIKVIVNNNYNVSFAEGGNTYTAYTGYGNQTVTLSLPYPNYFTVTPANYTYNFTNYGHNETANFCLAPNGTHPDLEITLLPLISARPGFDAVYKIIYKNKGTQTQSGTVALQFNDAVLDLVASNPAVTLQSTGSLSWDFTALAPFETRTITCTLNVNTPQEIPAVAIGDVLDFSANTTTTSTDETPADNTSTLSQTVIGAYDPNDKLVTEGSVIDISKVGEYLHYMIRFQNTGNAVAENVVVKDILPPNLDRATLEMIGTSHPYRSNFTNGTEIEFIFENINLPASSADESGSHGFVAFKIKPAATVTIDSVIENTGYVYFDFNFPIVTNTATTTVAALGNTAFETNSFSVYPNPVKNTVTVETKTNVSIHSIEIYNTIGQLVKNQAVSNFGKSTTLDVNGLKAGTYFMKINSDHGKTTRKFIKL